MLGLKLNHVSKRGHRWISDESGDLGQLLSTWINVVVIINLFNNNNNWLTTDKLLHVINCGMKLIFRAQLPQWNRWNVGMDKWFHNKRHCVCEYLSRLGLKLIHVSKIGPWNYQFLPWGRFNLKMSSYHYGNYHVKDKTIWLPSYL